MTDEETVTLHTSDNKEVEVLRSIAEESVTVRQVLEDNPSVAVPLVNVRSQILTKVVEFCKFNVDAKHMKDDEGRAALVEKKKAFVRGFGSLDMKTLCELISVANYMNIPEMVDVTCQAVVDQMKSSSEDTTSLDGIRNVLGIVNDFTPEEEEENMREIKFVFGGEA